MNIDEQRLQQFFTELNAKRKAFDENYKYFAPQLAPQFNCFDFIAPNENKLSEIIAHLLNPQVLNPQATHAQGNLFLKLFFKQIGIDYPDCNQEITTVNCEVAIQNNRRIDILVDFGKDCFGLAIENKPWTGDQYKQLSDYNKHLNNIYRNKYCLIYLSGYDSDPSENSITKAEKEQLEKSNHYKKINFFNIVSWLEQCEKASKSDHVKHFLRDFIAYCQKTFLGVTNMIDKDVIKKTILENDNNIELAFAVEKQMSSVKESLLKDFANSLKEKFEAKYKDKGWVCEIEDNFSSLFERYKGIKFYKRGWNKYRLRFHSERTRCTEFIWGVAKKDGNIPDINLDIKKLNENLNESGKKSNYWPWWCYFQEPYRNWDINVEPWLGIQSKEKEIVKFVMDKIEALIYEAEGFIDQAEGLTPTPKTVVNEADKQP